MKLRPKALWRVPVFCIIASWVSYYITIYLGGWFFLVRSADAGGGTVVSVDPLRSGLFDAVLFLLVLLVGGLWAFRSMTRKEIAVSAAITAALYAAVTALELWLPNFPVALSIRLAPAFNWTGKLSSPLYRLTDHLPASSLISCLAPFLFVLFGKKQPRNTHEEPPAQS